MTVPFGRQKVTAVLLATAGESEVADDKLRAASEVLDTKSLYPPRLLALLSWAAGYYHHPIGEVLPLGLSPGERRGKPERQLGEAGVALQRGVAVWRLVRLIGRRNRRDWYHCLRRPP